MKTNFDLSDIMFEILNGKTSLQGGVYPDDSRPKDSNIEDIVINTLDLEIDALPQSGTTNVNIYVPDVPIRIKGKQQLSVAKKRLRVLQNEVLNLIRKANVHGIGLTTGTGILMNEPSINQHYINIRVNWNIND